MQQTKAVHVLLRNNAWIYKVWVLHHVSRLWWNATSV